MSEQSALLQATPHGSGLLLRFFGASADRR